MKYCALCCIAKDEDLFLREWLAYHALIGFEHFIIYDNLSERPIHSFLSGWADKRTVTVIRNSEPLSQQIVYGHCLQAFGRDFQWIAFLDMDEFIRLSPGKGGRADIRLFLPEFEHYAGLGVNWRMFSSSGHESTPAGLVIENYRHCLGDNHHIKSIVQPAKVRACAGPHSFFMKAGEHAVNAGHLPIPDGMPFTPARTERIAVNHYFYKSRQCFEEKIAKGNPCNIQRRMQEFEDHLDKPTAEDAALAAFAPVVAGAVEAPEFKTATACVCPDGAAAASVIRSGREGQDLSQALLSLNDYWMRNRAVEADETDAATAGAETDMAGPGVSLPDASMTDQEILVLRAHAALLRREYDLAGHFLKRSFLGSPERQTLVEYANLCSRTGRMAEARSALDIVKHYAAKDLER